MENATVYGRRKESGKKNRDTGITGLPSTWGGEGHGANLVVKEKVVRPEGVEPPTYWFVASCSIH